MDGEDKLVVCDVCDRGFHISCLTPALSVVPEGSWLCSDCVRCQSCGSNSPGPGKTDTW
eukprot:COSAG05_NODE_12122_length_482_cov_1.462141_1_plen_58_part_01